MRLLPIFAMLLFLDAGGAWGQKQKAAPPAATPAPAPPEPAVDTLGRSTPYGTVFAFLKAAGAGDYARAAQFLNAKAAQSQELAHKLHSVMDAGLHGGIDRLSHEPEGDLGDGLPPTREKVGTADIATGPIDIELERIKQKDGSEIWLFSSKTLREIPAAYAATEPPEFVTRLPAFLRDTDFAGVSLWRWLLGIGMLTLVFVVSSLLSRLLIALARLLFHAGGQSSWQPETLRGPLRLTLMALAVEILSRVSATLLARTALGGVAAAIAIIGFAWLLSRVGRIAADIKTQQLIRQHRAGQITVLAMGRRLMNVLIVFITLVILLERFGVNVTALFAGLGLGGVAVALAARKTIENIFGGISLITREAMRVGDFCRINGQLGTVEDIGLGTTRLRTLDRTVVSMANAQLAQADLENLTMRDKFWLDQTIELRPATTQAQMAQILETVNAALKKNPKLETATARARFVGFNPSSMKLELFAYILDANHDAFLVTQERILLEVLRLIEAAGSGIGMRIVADTPLPPPPPANDLEKLAEWSI